MTTADAIEPHEGAWNQTRAARVTAPAAHDGRTPPGEGTDDMHAAIQAATKALGRASVGIQETADHVLAEAAVRAAAPILRQAVAEQIATALEAMRDVRLPDIDWDSTPAIEQTLAYAAEIAREIGAKP